MSTIWDLVEGFTSGVASAAAERFSGNVAMSIVERCCNELGWEIDERRSAREISLNFNDPITTIRQVNVFVGERGMSTSFRAASIVRIPTKQIQLQILGYLLERNVDPFIGWECITINGNVSFSVSYLAIAAGLNSDTFKLVCETLVKEVHEFDSRMSQAGLV